MAFRPIKIAVLALLPCVAGVWADISAAQAAQVPSEQSLFYRRYRGDDEVDDDRRGRGGRSGSSDDSGSISDGGGKPSSNGGSTEGNPKPGTQPNPGKGGNSSDDNDRFGR